MNMDDPSRNVYCLLGLPIDSVTMEQTVHKVINAVRKKQKLFISTPNLNFLVTSQNNVDFKKSVIHSDLSVADGMPIVFMCKLLGIPIKERVAGSSLIERLIENDVLKKDPVKVFFFGGDDGIAKRAHDNLNKMNRGLRSVGFLNPGFGNIDEMSREEIITTINDARPDFVIVSLGAAKGQAWIEHNKEKLNASVISHLGAVINFIAGTVKRAPLWVQRIHLEWMWRIGQEPALFNRYWNDGIGFIRLLFYNVLPLRNVINNKKQHSTPSISVDWKEQRLSLRGSIGKATLKELEIFFDQIIKDQLDFTLDLNGATFIDQAVLGHLLVLWEKMAELERKLKIIGLNHPVERIFILNKLGYMLSG